MNRLLKLSLAALALAAAAACNARPKLNVAAEEMKIRATDAQWLAAATSHDLDGIVPFWADDATIYPPDSAPIVGRDAIRAYVSGAFHTPGFAITWTTDKVAVSESGDLAYSSGTDRISVTAADGKPVTQVNHAVAVWKKQPDGSWKCVVDIMSPAKPPDALAPHN